MGEEPLSISEFLKFDDYGVYKITLSNTKKNKPPFGDKLILYFSKFEDHFSSDNKVEILFRYLIPNDSSNFSTILIKIAPELVKLIEEEYFLKLGFKSKENSKKKTIYTNLIVIPRHKKFRMDLVITDRIKIYTLPHIFKADYYKIYIKSPTNQLTLFEDKVDLKISIKNDIYNYVFSFTLDVIEKLKDCEIIFNLFYLQNGEVYDIIEHKYMCSDKENLLRKYNF